MDQKNTKQELLMYFKILDLRCMIGETNIKAYHEANKNYFCFSILHQIFFVSFFFIFRKTRLILRECME